MSFSLSPLLDTLPTDSVPESSGLIHPRPAVTASPASSIWRDLPESLFRQHVVALEKLTNAVPVDAQSFPLSSHAIATSDGTVEARVKVHADPPESPETIWADLYHRNSAGHPEHPRHRLLSTATEQRLANDIAYLVAVGEGAQSVAAATVQEGRINIDASTGGLDGGRDLDQQPLAASLKVTIASADAIEPDSQAFLRSVFQILSAPPPAKPLHRLLDLVIRHHQARLLNRLRSAKWKKPAYLARTHKKPLFADFANLIHRAQFLYSKKEAAVRAQLEQELLQMADLLEAFESETDDHEKLIEIAQSSYQFCTSTLIANYFDRLQAIRATAQIQACLKTLRQLEKIAAYYRICQTLISLSRSHPTSFESVQLLFLPPYEAVPLTIAYQPWAKSTHVHAEVILSVHHDLEGSDSPWHKPRCLGASKYFCYLCFLFIRHHGAYFAANTHGACYDQWTIPDLADYPESLAEHYRNVVRTMDEEVQHQTRGAKWRPEPMTSRENLIGLVDD
ncbi:hypothetical protein CORC01_08114 [Colletotrichum orchidophilum]|uniref:Uncharacterized protein n=1 Tax=Colletotrichum orchidophilum TaxID=1209926 RepID=A0A1G4B5A1_9PEZI|nr:uncharacterized protein CORC01_08114 [Colletotrichum orchidophilum]OHE96516.1 hypothetical protein CORC01_08114 [Colletotrichum orchidophilum]